MKASMCNISLSVILKSLFIHHWTYTSGESSNRSCVSVRLSIWTHISVTAGRNFLILGMMIYDLGMIPVILKF